MRVLQEFQREVAASQREREELGGAKREAQAALDDAKNTIEAQELVSSILEKGTSRGGFRSKRLIKA